MGLTVSYPDGGLLLRAQPAISVHDDLRAKAVEWERLEYNTAWIPGTALHTMCVLGNDFQNPGSGIIGIGLAETDGRPVLLLVGTPPESFDAIQIGYPNLGFNGMEPSYHRIGEASTIYSRTILVIWAPGGRIRPYKVRTHLSDKRSDWAHCIRQDSRSFAIAGPAATR